MRSRRFQSVIITLLTTLLCGFGPGFGGGGAGGSWPQEITGKHRKIFSASGPSGFAYVSNSVSACFQGSNASKCVFAVHNTPAAGQLRLISVFWKDSGSQTMSITSSNGDSWVSVTPGKVAGTLTGTTGFSFQRFSVSSSAGGADTITAQINTSTSSPMGWETTAYTYSGTISGFDGTPVLSNVTSSGSIGTTSSVTTSNASDLLWADCPGTVGTCSVGSGWTSRNDTAACNFNGATCSSSVNYNSTVGALVEDKVGITAGTYTATFGTTGATDGSVMGLLGI